MPLQVGDGLDLDLGGLEHPDAHLGRRPAGQHIGLLAGFGHGEGDGGVEQGIQGRIFLGQLAQFLPVAFRVFIDGPAAGILEFGAFLEMGQGPVRSTPSKWCSAPWRMP